MENFRESAALLHGSQNRCLRSDRCESGSLLDQILTAMRKSRDEEGKRNRYHDTKAADAVPYWKIDDFVGFAGFSWVWVVLMAARAKKVETKRFYTPPLGGKKTQAFLVAPQKGSFVGWLVI